MTTLAPATFNGVPVHSISLPSNAVQIGTDSDGLPVWMETLAESVNVIGSMTNLTDVPATLIYTAEVGSTRGFSQQIGMSVSATGGIDLKVFSASLQTTITGTLGFTQAFSKKTSMQVNMQVGPRCTTQVLEASLSVRYYACIGIPNPVKPSEILQYIVAPRAVDTIESGCYQVVESPVTSAQPASAA